jgi:hypothetical protein
VKVGFGSEDDIRRESEFLFRCYSDRYTDYDRLVAYLSSDSTVDLFGPLAIDGGLVKRDDEPGPPEASEDEDI